MDDSDTAKPSDAAAAGAAPATLVDAVDRVEDLARRRLALAPVSAAAAERARRLADHVARHLRVRARSLEAPLLVLLLGPTGAGKSTLLNTIAGEAVSPTGVLRPTTRTAVVLANPEDQRALLDGPLAGLDPGSVRFAAHASLAPGVAIVDAPDVDSIEHANRELADRLVEAADLCIFVTTAVRYADRVPWEVLRRIRERGLPLLVVVNRLPPAESDRQAVLDDVRRVLGDAGIVTERLGRADAAGRLEVTGVGEGALADGGESLRREEVEAIVGELTALRADRGRRVALAARALAGALAGLGPLVDEVADDCAHEAIDARALLRAASDSHERERASLLQAVRGGSFLRTEALRHWQEYVGADDVTRLFSRGIGAVRGWLAAAFRPSTAPIAEVRGAATDDLLALTRRHAGEAARRTATAWSDEPAVAAALAADPGLWAVSDGFDERFRERIEAWVASISADIAETGAGKRRLARGASIGVNALGTGVMLATFIHTAGLTGAEVGIAAGTAYLNQKLLNALFGEAAMVELIARARLRLDAALAETFAEERARFDRLVPDPSALEALADELHAAAGDLRKLSRPAVEPA